MSLKVPCASDLRYSITFQRLSDTPDSVGQRSDWEDYWTTRGAIIPQGGTEQYTKEEVVADAPHVILVRYNPSFAVTPKDRATSNGRIFDITNVNNMDDPPRIRPNRWLKITAIERL